MMTPNEAAAGQKILNQINESDIDDELSKIVNFNNQLKSDLNDVKKISSSIIDDQREMISMLLQKSKLENDKKWEFTRRQIMKLFKLPIRENLKTSEEFKNINMPNEPSFEGAEDYLLSLENFFIFINAYIKAKVEEIESCEELMRTSKHAEMSKKKRDRIDQIIKKYESNHYKFQLIEHLINSKFWMMIYMEGYLCAYEYWTLSKPEIKPSIIKTFQDLEKDMNKIRDELEKHIAKPIPANEFRYRESSSLNSSEFNKTEKYIDYDNKYKNNDKIYFVPTPFCQWKISLNTKNDFSELRSINIHLYRDPSTTTGRHPNMDAELQQARIQISGPNSGIENISQEKLQHIRKELRSSISGVELESFTENAQAILDTFLI
ncbi:hypothetical protein C2G38_2246123 [Gigaspora rosea]|uniref:Uncharacterized protein n=1 Tax=Gigaspora rosea TaxID=44941 RepID=A0A397V7I5_9GLOM|nr:hypothetical protein C2G38_2246123 [Gigaspora rosea]